MSDCWSIKQFTQEKNLAVGAVSCHALWGFSQLRTWSVKNGNFKEQDNNWPGNRRTNRTTGNWIRKWPLWLDSWVAERSLNYSKRPWVWPLTALYLQQFCISHRDFFSPWWLETRMKEAICSLPTSSTMRPNKEKKKKLIMSQFEMLLFFRFWNLPIWLPASRFWDGWCSYSA